MCAKMTDAFPSNFLKAEDISHLGKDVVVTIAKVTEETLGQGANAERKFVVEFAGKDKKLVLNKTNFKSIITATGEDDTDNWTGKKISLFVMDVEYQGDLMPAIRVRPRPPAPAGAASQDRGTATPAPAKASPRQPAPPPSDADLADEDVPF